MDFAHLVASLEEALSELPLLDAHTHMDAVHPAARGLDDVLLYHMVISDLYSAGCPDGGRLSEWPSVEESHSRLERALPYVKHIQNTSCFWGVRIILRDLYGWEGPVLESNWRTLDTLIRERATQSDWAWQILDKAGIKRTCTELWRRHEGQADERFQYSLEWAFFARSQWGEFDTALYELENAWSQGGPGAPLPVTAGEARSVPVRQIHTLDDVEEALDFYYEAIPYDEVLSTAQHLSTDLAYRQVSQSEMADALTRRGQAGPTERDTYASYVLEGFLSRLGKLGRPFVFQFSLGAEPLPYETVSRLNPPTIAHLAELVARHPSVQFQCFLSSAAANQSLCTLARELPNFSLAGYWWHNFFPTFIEQVLSERLDMLSTRKQVGFFSDAYTAEWAYAKAVLIRKAMARVLASKIAQGQYDFESAVGIARALLFESAQDLLGMTPREG